MLKSYLKIAYRNLWGKRIFLLINVTGLAVGIASCFLIFLYVRFEFSYDQFHSKANRIYRLVSDLKSSPGTFPPETPAPMAKAIKAEFPEVQEVTRFIPGSVLIRKGNFKFQEEHTLWADPSFFIIFDFPLKYGNPKTALREPNSIVFSETAAYKYFGDSNPVGQSVSLTGLNLHGIVTGVMKDIPENSHIKGDMLISMSTYSQSFAPGIETDWGSFNYSTYLLLSPDARPENILSKLPAFLQKYAGDEMKKINPNYRLQLEPLKDIYLHSSHGAMVAGNLGEVYIFSIIAAFVLLIACVNFINLTTARSLERAKEVGIRKCAGATKNQLIRQFLIEFILVAVISYLLSIILCYLLLPLFNQISGKTISTGIFKNGLYPLLFFGVSLGIGILAGLYPAFVLSSFKPAIVLKGRFASGNKGIVLRKLLVVTQFTISIALISGTLVIYSQLNFMRNKSLGFNKNQMLVVSNNGDPGIFNFKKEITDISAIQSSSISSSIPGRAYNVNGNDVSSAQVENSNQELQLIDLNFYNVDYDFLGLYKIKMLVGRDFSREFPSDSTNSVILNKSAVIKLGYSSPQQIIGKRFVSDLYKGTVIGVVDDFHFQSLKETIQPLCIRTNMGYWQYISIKVNATNLPATIDAIKNKWDKTIPMRPFNYFFLDEYFNNQYRSEERFGHLIFYFSLLALFVSSLGLLGLSSYSILQRTREIGIRKVLGASISGIVRLLSKDFLRLVTISFIIASPLSWFALNSWLQGFAYRINLSWEILVTASAIALLIALATVSFQAVKAAIANPVKSLRTE